MVDTNTGGFGASWYSDFFDNAPLTAHYDSFAELIEHVFDKASDTIPATQDAKSLRVMISPSIISEGLTRSNDNCVAFGGWISGDHDDGTLTIEDAKAMFEELGCPFALYTTTKCTTDHHKFRSVVALNRWVEAEEMRRVWACFRFMLNDSVDDSTKDQSRGYTIPADWQPGDLNPEPYVWSFVKLEGVPLCVDTLLTAPLEDTIEACEPLAQRPPSPPWDGSRPELLTERFIEEYCALPKGKHHSGLFSLMVKVAMRAVGKGFPLTADGLVEFARQADDACPIKTAHERWKTIHKEAERALARAAQQASLPDEGQIDSHVKVVADPMPTDFLRILPTPRQWSYGKFLVTGHTTVLGGPGGTGKTTLATAIALSIASGKSLLSSDGREQQHHIYKRGPVWIYNLEDGKDEVIRRVAGCALHHGLTESDLSGKVFINSARDQKLVIAKRHNGNLIASPCVDDLIEDIVENRIKLMIVDPFIHSHDLDENSNGDMAFALSQWNQVAEKAKCAILLIHHTKKGGNAGDAESFRGASAISGAARVMETVATMTKEEASSFGIAETERRFYIRRDSAKGNMAAPDEAEWFKLESVKLNNGDHDYPDGDFVQAIVPAIPKNPMKDISPAGIMAICAAIEAAPEDDLYRAKRQSGERWIGHLFVRHCISGDVNDKKAIGDAASRAVDAWLKSGFLIEKEFKSDTRKLRMGVALGMSAGAVALALGGE